MGWLDSGGGDAWDMLTPDQQQMILESEEDTMKRITVDPNSGHTTIEPNPDNGPSSVDRRLVELAQHVVTFSILGLAATGSIWCIVKLWDSILSTF